MNLFTVKATGLGSGEWRRKEAKEPGTALQFLA